MRLLLDTHAFLWMSTAAPEISTKATDFIADNRNTKLLRIVSLWEIAIKAGLDKLALHEPYPAVLARIRGQSMLQRLPIEDAHLLAYFRLPMHHKDPFDRMLVAQALADDLTLVSGDESLDRYGVSRVW